MQRLTGVAVAVGKAAVWRGLIVAATAGALAMIWLAPAAGGHIVPLVSDCGAATTATAGETAVSTWQGLLVAAEPGTPTSSVSVYLANNITAPATHTDADSLEIDSGINMLIDLDGCTLDIEGPAAGLAAIEIPNDPGSALTIADSSAAGDGVLNADGGAGSDMNFSSGGGAGIGWQIGKSPGPITITGGTINATGGAGAAGAVGEAPAGGGGAGIGGAGSGAGETPHAAGTVTITGGDVTAVGGAAGSSGVSAGAGIGAGGWDASDSCPCGQASPITIGANADVTASSDANTSAVGPFQTGVSGDPLTINGTLVIPAGAVLDVPAGETFTNTSANGDRSSYLDLYGSLAGDGTVANSGAIDVESGGSVAANGTGNGTTGLQITGNNYDVSFDVNGSSSAPPPDQYVYADTFYHDHLVVPDGPTMAPSGLGPFAYWTVGSAAPAVLDLDKTLADVATSTSSSQKSVVATAQYDASGSTHPASPTVSVGGLKAGATYAATLPKVSCKATATGLTIANCQLGYVVTGDEVAFTATAEDSAAVSAMATTSVKLASAGLSSSEYALTVYPTKVGKNYKLLVLSGTQPLYTGMKAGKGKPSSSKVKMKADGTVVGIKRWSTNIKVTKAMLKHSSWALGYKTGGTIHTIEIKVSK